MWLLNRVHVNRPDSLQINALGQSALGRKVITHHLQMSEYMGELFGVEYLYSQSGYILSPKRMS